MIPGDHFTPMMPFLPVVFLGDSVAINTAHMSAKWF